MKELGPCVYLSCYWEARLISNSPRHGPQAATEGEKAEFPFVSPKKTFYLDHKSPPPWLMAVYIRHALHVMARNAVNFLFHNECSSVVTGGRAGGLSNGVACDLAVGGPTGKAATAAELTDSRGKAGVVNGVKNFLKSGRW